jgi:ubiquitin-conjugating enzyme (huntingtin interacting protein 2)
MRPNDHMRVQKEIKNILKDTASGVTVELKNESSIKYMTGSLLGPKDSPYEGGIFYVDIELDEQYPFVPPKMKFITRVWHPNISSASGAICLDVLKDQWSPALTIKTALLSLQALLSTPEPNDPQDAVVAKQYLTDKAAFDRTAKQWTEQYAHHDQAVGMKQKVKKFTEMGFEEARVLEVLQAVGGDEAKAMEELLK